MPKVIKVLHVLHAFSSGGMENGVVNIINGSPDHLVHELCILSRADAFLQRLRKPVRYHELHRREGNDLRLLFTLRELFRRANADIVHTRNWGAFDGVFAACLTPGTVLVHGEHGRDVADPQGTNKRRNFTRRTFAFRTKKMIAVSKNLYGWLRETVGVPESKLLLIPNGVDTHRFRPGKNRALRQQLGIADDEFVIGTVSRLDKIKNHKGLIDAVQDINFGPRKVRLVIVGDGPEKPHIEFLIRRVRTNPRPVLVGYAPNVESYYPMFDAFVLNSFGEGMSNTLLEAMSSGLPTVCTAVGGNPELIADTVRGILVRSGADSQLQSAICQYRDSSELRKVHGTCARQFIEEHFSLDRMIQQYVQLYETVAS